MFEPLVHAIGEYGERSTTQKVKLRFIFKELEEIQSRGGAWTDPGIHDSKLVATVPTTASRKRKRDGIAEEVEENEDDVQRYEYRGLYSGVAYDKSGKILDNNILSKRVAKSSSNKESKYYQPSIEVPVNLTRHGYEALPRVITPLAVNHDGPATMQAQFSPSAKRVLCKNNNPLHDSRNVTPKSLYYRVLTKSYEGESPEHLENDLLFKSLRHRHTQILSTKLYGAMLDRDYATAARALAILIRVPGVDIRSVWPVALELLVWRRECREKKQVANGNVTSDADGLPTNGDIHTLPEKSSETHEDEKFLNWLIINFPYLRTKSNTTHSRIKTVYDRAPEFYPHLILSKLRHSNPKAALDKLQEIMLRTPYSDDPLLHCYAGMAVMQLMVLEPDDKARANLADRARKYFDQCQNLGGNFTKEFIDYELNKMVPPVHRSDDDDDDSEDDEDIDETTIIATREDDKSVIKHDDSDGEVNNDNGEMPVESAITEDFEFEIDDDDAEYL